MEEIAKEIMMYVSRSVEMLAAIIIGFAVIKTILAFLRNLLSRKASLSTEEIRLQFGRAVAVALELLLGADVLSTAVAPSWNDIGKLAAIAVLRTALNYFLGKELEQAQKHTAEC